MNKETNICLECGLCCDGTLIGFVELNKEEQPAIREIMQIEEVGGHGFFLHPCCKLGVDGCEIYAKRPHQCANFKCGLLKSVENLKLNFESAVKIINEVRQKKLAIEEQIDILSFNLQSQSFYFKIIELKKLFEKNDSEFSESLKHAELLSTLRELNALIISKFGISFL
jgi:Fe-S-cluster containining protein